MPANLSSEVLEEEASMCNGGQYPEQRCIKSLADLKSRLAKHYAEGIISVFHFFCVFLLQNVEITLKM